MGSPYTHCRKCRQPILLSEFWMVDYLCPSCRILKHMDERHRPKQKLPEYTTDDDEIRVKMIKKTKPIISKNDLYFIILGILGLMGLFLLVIG